jgi:hypothetical protein
LGSITVLSAEAGLTSTLYDKGVIFMKDRDILLTGDKWTLAVNTALDGYVNLIQGMRFILAQIRRNIEAHKSFNRNILDIHWEQVERLHKITDELETDLMSVSKLLSEEVPIRYGQTGIRRTRRGLINYVVSIWTKIFIWNSRC